MTSVQSLPDITATPAWDALRRHHEQIGATHLRQFFDEDPDRGRELTVSVGDLYIDYSKHRITRETLRLLVDLARTANLEERRDQMFAGAHINVSEDRAVLHTALRLPRDAELIVDGHNVTRAEWDDVTLEAQRNRLLRGLAPLVAQTGAEITVVFDGTNAETRPLVRPPRGVRVLFSPRGVLADDVIRDLVDAEPAGRPVGVVTSDQEVARDVVGKAGVRVVGSRALVRLLG